MMLQALFSWWYGAGWADLGRRVGQRIDSSLAFFSVGLLARTLFDPFRQIDAGTVRGPIGLQFRAWVDRTFSRFVGFFVRSTMILFGLVVAAMLGVVGIIQLLLWPLVPFLPIVGLGLMLVGWTP
jgi:hypothetical protein